MVCILKLFLTENPAPPIYFSIVFSFYEFKKKISFSYYRCFYFKYIKIKLNLFLWQIYKILVLTWFKIGLVILNELNLLDKSHKTIWQFTDVYVKKKIEKNDTKTTPLVIWCSQKNQKNCVNYYNIIQMVLGWADNFY